MNLPPSAPSLAATHFDGHSPQGRPVQLRLEAGWLLARCDDGQTLRWPVREIQWPERQRHGQRLAHLPDGSTLSHPDGPAWDAWAAAARPDGWLVHWMQSWRGVGVALACTLALLVGGWAWGLPAASQALVQAVPADLERSLGERALLSFETSGLHPSRLSAARQAEIRQSLSRAVALAYRAGPTATGATVAAPGLPERPDHVLLFRAAPALGPNAFALPGGLLVLTDELAELLADQPAALTGVLAHELGHVRGRHGLRMVVQAGLVSAGVGLMLGDTSSWLATVPVLLGQQAYSRDFEREADDEAVRVMQAAGLPPQAMVVFFDRLADERRKDATDKRVWALPIAIASHPDDAERIARFRAAR